MSYAVGRLVFAARSLGTSQAVRSAALIGEGVAAPANGVAVNDVKPTEFDVIELVVDVTFAYTGGSANPTFQVRVQRKFALDLPDSDDNAWEDVGAFTAFTVNAERSVYLGLMRLTATALSSTGPETGVLRDAITAGVVNAGHPGEKLRIRETVSGGDRTGGNLTYDLRLLGVTAGDVGRD